MKVSELSGALLDYWTARAEGHDVRFCIDRTYVIVDKSPYCPSTNWAIGGPIIERERIDLYPRAGSSGPWTSCTEWGNQDGYQGDSPLVAAMRCFVAWKFGDTVPDEVTQ